MNSVSLTEIVETPPFMIFSLQICEDFTNLYFKRNTKIGYDNLINYFTDKVEKFSQTKFIINRLKDARHHLTEELSQITIYIKFI